MPIMSRETLLDLVENKKVEVIKEKENLIWFKLKFAGGLLLCLIVVIVILKWKKLL